MAIACIAKPFSGAIFKMRLPVRRRSKPSPVTPPTSDGIAGTSKTDELRQVFRFLDVNNDGKISAEELTAYFDSVGDSVSREDAKKIIGEFSGGRGGEEALLLGYAEFARVMELRETEDDRAVLRRAFEVYEVEKGSGCITPAGLRQVFRRLGEAKSVEECEAMIRVYDLDGNGVLDFDEFYKMMT